MSGCAFEGCDRLTKYASGALCTGHIEQQRLGRTPGLLGQRNKWVDGVKVCSACGTPKPRAEYDNDYSRTSGARSDCKPCYAKRDRAKHLKVKYGVSLDWYATTLAAQDGHCAVCPRTEDDEGTALHVDHDHACCPGIKACGDCVRGLLCGSCNRGLGLFRDSPELLARASLYLTRTVDRD